LKTVACAFSEKVKKVKNEHEREWRHKICIFSVFSRGVMNEWALKSSRNGDEKERKMAHQFVIHFFAQILLMSHNSI
jgi:hypothetical protein